MNHSDNGLINDIVSRFHGRRYSGKVKKNFHLWLLSEGHFTAKDKAMAEVWDNTAAPADKSVFRSLNAVEAKLGMIQGNNKNSSPISMPPLGHRWTNLMRVAAVLLPAALLLAAYFIWNPFSSGRVETLYAEAPYGETVQCTLPDGSRVWLNAGSSLEYPSRFTGDTREVRLDGEGFFDVTHNRRRPFIVLSDHLRTEVVGTEFNICSYDNQKHECVTVISGEVNVYTKNNRKYNLTADGHLTHWKRGQTEIESVDGYTMTSWMNNGLVFENSTVEDIMWTLQRAYNLRVLVDPSRLTSNIYRVRFDSGESLYEILNVVQQLTGTTCRMAGGTLFFGSNPVMALNPTQTGRY